MAEEIINKVADSGLITLNLENYYTPGERAVFDLKDVLYEGLLLREKDLRDFAKDHDWSQYKDKLVAVTCSADAIVPTWAFMLIASKLAPHARKIVLGDLNALETALFTQALSQIRPEAYTGQRLIIKGCSKVAVPESAYVELISKLQPVAHSIFYGEACSTVPLYKRK